MATNQAYIGVDGLIAIAKANGMVNASYCIAGDCCTVVLFVGGVDHAYSYTMDDVRATGRGGTLNWICHRDHMLKSWSISKAIRTHFKDAVEAAERELVSR